MKKKANILLVDDEPGMLRYIRTLLEVDEHHVETETTGEAALDLVQKGLRPDLVLLDLLMPGIDGMETLEQLRKLQPEIKVVMLSCVNDTKKVVQAIHLGATDYITKPFQKAELDKVIDQCLGTNQENYAGGEVEELGDEIFFVAASPNMRKLRSQAALVANVDIPVLMLGESGTGKEVMARLIHKLSPRAHRTFLKVNCAAVPADLLESELFGYEAGAFTGANHAKPGKFEICNKGTILLDEIGEMPPSLQAKLLHVLQDQQFSRLGSRSVIKVDVRILAATNINIPEALANKTLREDLYYRLNAFTLTIPPLRERR
jgi:two-component system response regulator AtoC